MGSRRPPLISSRRTTVSVSLRYCGSNLPDNELKRVAPSGSASTFRSSSALFVMLICWVPVACVPLASRYSASHCQSGYFPQVVTTGETAPRTRPAIRTSTSESGAQEEGSSANTLIPQHLGRTTFSRLGKEDPSPSPAEWLGAGAESNPTTLYAGCRLSSTAHPPLVHGVSPMGTDPHGRYTAYKRYQHRLCKGQGRQGAGYWARSTLLPLEPSMGATSCWFAATFRASAGSSGCGLRGPL